MSGYGRRILPTRSPEDVLVRPPAVPGSAEAEREARLRMVIAGLRDPICDCCEAAIIQMRAAADELEKLL